jgi:small GTP-binding protein
MWLPEKLMRYKMILFGNEGVGKTSLVERFVNDKFEENYIATLGYNVYEKRILHNDSIISLMVYDIGGQERFDELRKRYSQGAHTAFIVYDVTDPNSFTNIRKWKTDLDEYVGSIPFIIIGNKIDLETERKIKIEDALKMCSMLGGLGYYETSAKNGKGVEDAFNQLAIMTYTCYNAGKIYT